MSGPTEAPITTSRDKGRPKGYISDYRPRADTLRLIEQVRDVLQEYRAYLPLTVRQIFYRLVGAYGAPKTEKFYRNVVCAHIANARRARLIPFNAIRDDGVMVVDSSEYADADQFFRTVRYMGESYRRDLLVHQPIHMEVWCEAAGMVPQLATVARDYCVPVYSASGFDGLTVKKQLADRICSISKPTIILHLGDFDPSGDAIFNSMAADVKAFVEADRYDARADVQFVRVALTEQQITDHDLPTSPAKPTDSRSRNWQHATCQLEALPPDLLATLLRSEIEGRLDQNQLNADRQAEIEERQTIAFALPAPNRNAGETRGQS